MNCIMNADNIKTGKLPSVTEIIEGVKSDMCRNYCKYPDTWDDEKMGCELCESVICANCPLNRL